MKKPREWTLVGKVVNGKSAWVIHGPHLHEGEVVEVVEVESKPYKDGRGAWNHHANKKAQSNEGQGE